MGRGTIAAVGGIAAFALYLVLVLELAMVVSGVHWALDLVFFALAGIVWAFPAARLVRWVVAGRQGG
ncbi:MAG: DUF2842 domain-containing protein [Acetobacteraceae bacterium]|jgi:hypothetical protein|nr:DUF2842 domain-containing protein [Acetobacteraceae bacterium]